VTEDGLVTRRIEFGELGTVVVCGEGEAVEALVEENFGEIRLDTV
jgi:hypothetical protein